MPEMWLGGGEKCHFEISGMYTSNYIFKLVIAKNNKE